MRQTLTSRRELLKSTTALIGAGLLGSMRDVFPQSSGRFKIGACDWSIGMRAKTGAMALARQIGLDGVQVSMGSVESGLALRQPDVQRAYRDAAEASGVRVGGVALDVMNQVPYKSDPRTEQWVSDSIDVAHALNVRVVLLAFFDRGDLRKDAEGQAEVVRRLKRVARKAEDRGVILGIESWLSADELVRMLDAIGSRNVQVYYDVANSTQMGYNINAEIRQLGRERICEFHAKENGSLLGEGIIDFAGVRRAMDDIGYTGWIQIEGAVPKGKPMLESYLENATFMRAQFG